MHLNNLYFTINAYFVCGDPLWEQTPDFILKEILLVNAMEFRGDLVVKTLVSLDF
jgi:hypothetical protein